MKKIMIKGNKILYIFVLILLIAFRLYFSKDFPSFFVKTMKIDDELMVNQMMTLSQRNIFRFLLSKNIDKRDSISPFSLFIKNDWYRIWKRANYYLYNILLIFSI